MTLEELVEAAKSRIRRYTPEEAHAAAQHGAVLVDIRAQDARDRGGVIAGAYHVPRTVLEWRIASAEWRNPAFDGHRLILVCDHGCSSLLAAATLVELGRDAGDVIGGFEAWQQAGLPVTPAVSRDAAPGFGPPD